MLKRTLACALFAITGHAYSADIQVTTLLDEENYTGCSLRNAVEFLNQRSKKEFENGYHGCGNKDSSPVIVLQRDQIYQLKSELPIKAEMTIRSAVNTDFNSTKGLNNATIKMAGTDRLFSIDDGDVEKALIVVVFSELNLQGSSTKVNNGGLIVNREDLRIEYSRLAGGLANRGGAIYNVGTSTLVNKTAGSVSISNSILQGNKADQGAIIYSEMPRYVITQSVLRDNEGSVGPTGALLYVQEGINNDTVGAALGVFASIKNSSIFHNKGGYVANIREGMILNNNTIIKNAAGLYLQALRWKVVTKTNQNGEEKEEIKYYPSSFISNSIIVANGNNDFTSTTDDTSIVQSNFTTSECKGFETTKCLPNVIWNQNDPEQKLIAGGTNDEGLCAAPPAKGLLCPYYTPKDQMLGFFKPRLLTSYLSVADSPIVNRGRIYSDGTTYSLATCEGSDQRGKKRSGLDELCDLGAVELLIDRNNIPTNGMDLLYNQIAKFSIVDSLADGELLDPASCEAKLGKRTDGQPWQPGCLEIVQNLHIPSKGKLTLDQDGNVTYVPYSNWHGQDMFKLRVMTTITRFNDATSYYIDIPTNIDQAPPNDFQSKTVNVGSFGVGAILMLLGLVGIRRFKS
ncbi:rhombotarget A [Acinetobacter dispersus]|uniref:rhombotarget A n=1 Tax=Acinetobacter dispersus TaxID=70348 RepID=UPI001F4AF2D0|nr:rhombotarget A [Acinetobacter dispersus]MCH7392998.1 rhombotarget A [Acinetobacter dispersus]